MLPKFTAEAALEVRSAHYRMGDGPAFGSLAGGGTLVPQQVGALEQVGALGLFDFGCFTAGPWSAGPISVSASGCAFPPQACVTISGFGLSRRFCIP
jgi:hypothetical protein